MAELFSFYEQMIIDDIAEEIQEYIEDIPFKKNLITTIKNTKHTIIPNHSERLFEFTTHPSQTWDTLIKQKVREAKHFALHHYEDIKNPKEEAYCYAKNIFEECKKRIYSLENAKIPAHAQMTPKLLQKVPSFFSIYNRYKPLPQWKAEEKAEEKNISFAAFLDEEKQEPVYLDERVEAVMTAKKMLLSGETSFYQWIDFDGAKRPDGIMLSIFAELLIDDINQSARGISETSFVQQNSLFTLSEREENRKIVSEFHRIDRSIFALTRYLASQSADAENPVCIAQMEQLKKDRERYLRKLVKIRDESKARKSKTTEEDIVYLSERVHFIPRFDPKFIDAVQKSDLGNTLEKLSKEELQHYKTASHIIDQILTLNSLSPDTVNQIILAQCCSANEIITLENFIKEKVKWWKEKKAQYFAEDPLETLSLCPLLETKKSTKKENVEQMLEELFRFYGKERMQSRIPEFFFAGSDLSKSMGSWSSFVRTWECAMVIWQWNKTQEMDIRVKLGSGESTFRQSGFLDPKFDKSIFKKDLSSSEQQFLKSIFGVHWQSSLTRKGNGMISLLKKYPWLNSITLQSKAREWIMSMGANRLSKILLLLQQTKQKNRMLLAQESPFSYAPSPAVQKLVAEENIHYERCIGSEQDAGKSIVSLPSLIELLATEITPVLRDRALKRESDSKGISGSSIRKKLIKSPQINARAISANTASSVLFPLALVGKGEAFFSLSSTESVHDQENALECFEIEDLLQVIRQFDPISSEVFLTMKENGFEKVAVDLEKSWQYIQNMVPLLIHTILKTSFPAIAVLPEEEKEKCIACLEPRLRSLFSEKSAYSSEFIEMMKINWIYHAKPVVAKACQFLSNNSDEYPFTKEDVAGWDMFLTIHCRLRGDKGLLG